MPLREALRAVLKGEYLSREEMRTALESALTADTDPVLLGGLLSALATRGESSQEIAGGAEALRAAALPFEHDHPHAIDTCGTGGDGLGLFNLSTAAALVAAAAGAKVIKHGGRSVSSRSGSADLLEAAGVPLELDPAGARAVLDEVGITFLFAPRYHPAMRFAAPVRASLGVRTLFNFLGPLANPGGVRRQLLGVSDPERVEQFAQALESLGCERALVVHGAGGADELTLAGENRVQAVGPVGAHSFDAEAAGLARAPLAALEGGDAADNLRLFEGLLDGEMGPLCDAVVLNAAAAVVVAGIECEVGAAVERAREALASGSARRTLDRWRRVARRVSGGGAR